MIIIGLTGGIGSGKSTISSFFKDQNIPVLCADQIAHQILDEPETQKKLIKLFGEKIDRTELGKIVFSDQKKLNQLNELLHPIILNSFKEKISIYREKRKENIILLDIPLLFETHMNELCDYTILVYVPLQTQIRRVEQRDSLSKDEIQKRINAQLSIEEKKKLADFIIDNSGDLENTKQQVLDLLKKLIGLSQSLQ